jgi:hypothetical protein
MWRMVDTRALSSTVRHTLGRVVDACFAASPERCQSGRRERERSHANAAEPRVRQVLRTPPDLARERSKPGPGAVAWDKQLLALGALLMLAGTSVFLLAMRENRFFSAVVRVQTDRGHAVCDTGPYKVVRHPGQAGMIVGTLGFPLLFMSAWSVIPVLLAVALMVVRTRMEDAFLEQHLVGYRDYQRATRYRLAPDIR